MTLNTADFRIPPLFVSPEIGGIGGGGGDCNLILVQFNYIRDDCLFNRRCYGIYAVQNVKAKGKY